MDTTMPNYPWNDYPSTGSNGYYLVNYQAYVRNLWLNSQPNHKSFLKKQPKFRPIYVYNNDEEAIDSDTESSQSNESESEKMSREEIASALDEFLHGTPPTDGYIHSVIDEMVEDLEENFSEINLN